jgi:hypothetical protein
VASKPLVDTTYGLLARYKLMYSEYIQTQREAAEQSSSARAVQSKRFIAQLSFLFPCTSSHEREVFTFIRLTPPTSFIFHDMT